MKNLVLCFSLVLFSLFVVVDLVQSEPAGTVTTQVTVIATPAVTPHMAILAAAIDGPVHITWYVILMFIIGLYELVVRLIPSVASFSLLALIIDILKLISDYLKRKKS